MSLFKPVTAAPKMPFKGFFFGLDGAGKTCTGLLLAEALAARRKGRIAFLDTEYNAKIYAHPNPARKCHPEPFDFDLIETRSLVEADKALKSLDPKENPVIVIDSWTLLDKACIETWEAANPSRVRPKTFEWGTVRKPIVRLLRWVKATPCDVIVLLREKDQWAGEGDDGRVVGVTYDAWAKTAFEFNVRGRMSLEKSHDGYVHVLTILKDHWSINEGQKIVNPTSKMLEAYYPFIGSDVEKIPDEDETAIADTEAYADDENKRKDREEKSRAIFDEFSTRIQNATKSDELTAIAGELKKLKRSIVADHLASLTLQFSSKSDALKPKV